MDTDNSLDNAIRAMRELGLIPACGRRFNDDTQNALEGLLATIVKDVPEYSQTQNPDVLPELRQHFAAHLENAIALLTGKEADPQFIVEHAHRQAEQHFPLDAGLRAYQCLSRVLADRVRDAAIAVADEDQELRRVVAATAGFAMAYKNVAASLATREYVAATRMLAVAAGDRKTELFNLLLDGFDESDSRAALLLRAAGYLEQRQTYAVIAVRAVQASEMADAERVQRIQHSLKEVLHGTRVRLLVGRRDNLAIALVSATNRLSGWTRPHTLAGDLAAEPMRQMGNAVLIGISNDVPSTAHIPHALHEAVLALDHAHRSHRVQRFSDLGLLDLIVQRARRDGGPIRPAWLPHLMEKDRHGKLAKTLQAYAENDMNVLRTARQLGMHPNSMYARFAKIEAITGLAPQRYHALTELLLALRINPA